MTENRRFFGAAGTDSLLHVWETTETDENKLKNK